MSKFERIEINGEEVLYNFIDKDIIEDLLIVPEHWICLFRKDKNTGEIIKDNDFQNGKFLPTLEAVIESKGYEIHTFSECEELYGELFEKDELYLPFDMEEVYITLNDVYQGCCTRGGWEFSTKDYHYFFGIITNEIG
jgi:hypothetical protein